jgi:hypothetical protein
MSWEVQVIVHDLLLRELRDQMSPRLSIQILKGVTDCIIVRRGITKAFTAVPKSGGATAEHTTCADECFSALHRGKWGMFDLG